METYPHVTYRYEISLHGDAACVWQTAKPMAPMFPGDVISSTCMQVGLDEGKWPALETLFDQSQALLIRGIEHLIYGLDGRELVHHLLFYCRAVPDRYAESMSTGASVG